MPVEARQLEPIRNAVLPAGVEPRSIPQIAREHIVSLAKLVVEYALQPIVEINTGHVYGYEALMRGFDRLNLASPTQLLDHAARSGSIVALEKMLLRRAIAKFASTTDVTGKRLFLNLDGRTLGNNEELRTVIVEALKGHKIPPSTICIELSERHNNAEAPGFAETVKHLRSMGARIAIDDFGIGFSEMKMLCDYGIDYVKIDGHFIHGIAENHRKRLFVTTIANLAHVLGIRVIAEGVEDESDYHGAREAGCDLIQGHFVARPTIEVTGLLPTYGTVAIARGKQRRNRKTDEILVRSEMLALPAIQESMALDVVFELFRQSPQQSFFPVVDAEGAPRGIIHERDLKQFIYKPFGRDLLRNKSFARSLSSFVTPCPVADVNSDAGRILEIFTNARGSDAIIVTENLKYVGVLSASALLKVISEKQIQQAQDQNPLTEMPGNLSISDHVAAMAVDGDQSRHFCYFDFDNFKPFNDRYGFQRGDRAISLFASLLRRHLAGPGVFLGHVGGDDFFACCAGRTREALEPMLISLLDEFRHDVAKLYDQEDQIAGRIIGTDRDSRPREFPLMRCSAAVVELPPGVITTDLSKIDVLIADGKSQAKRSDTGLSWRQYE